MTVNSILSTVRLMHERELFGGRVSARSSGGEPVMLRAERVRSVSSSAAEGPFVVRMPICPRLRFVDCGRAVHLQLHVTSGFSRSSWSTCMTERSTRRRSYQSGPVAR